MTETRFSTLITLALAAAALAYLLAVASYTSIPFPTFAAVPLVLLAVAELVIAKVVRDRIRRRRSRSRDARVLHPMQVARAAVLAKASSAGGALLAGGYLGLVAWTLPRRDQLLTTGRASLIAGTAALASAALVVAALLLERACRTPDPDGARE